MSFSSNINLFDVNIADGMEKMQQVLDEVPSELCEDTELLLDRTESMCSSKQMKQREQYTDTSLVLPCVATNDITTTIPMCHSNEEATHLCDDMTIRTRTIVPQQLRDLDLATSSVYNKSDITIHSIKHLSICFCFFMVMCILNIMFVNYLHANGKLL